MRQQRLSRSESSQAGYSLTEMLVVVAIIGVVSLVSIPSFIAMQRSGRLKSSMRQFTSDLRMARNHAVTHRTETKVGFTTGTSAREYRIYEWTGAAWRQLGDARYLEQTCYVANQTNFRTDEIIRGTTRDSNNADYDVIFRPNGAVNFDPGVTAATLIISTDFNLPKNQYTIDVNVAGRIRAL